MGQEEDADVVSQLWCPCSASQQCEEGYGEMLSVQGRLGNSYQSVGCLDCLTKWIKTSESELDLKM